MKRTIILIVLAIGILAGIAHWLTTRGNVETDDAQIEGHITPLAPKVAGYVVELMVRDNQHVKKGDILLKIDPRDYQAAYNRADAQLRAAEARLIAGQHEFASTSVSAPSNLESAQSQVAAADAELKNADQTLARLQKLSDAARSRQSLEDAQAARKQAKANMDKAQAQLRAAKTAPDTVAASEAQVKELEAAVDDAQAMLDKAKNDLDDTIIRAPEDGRITSRAVEMGAYVQPGQQLAALVGDTMWVVANFKETQLEGMKQGQDVAIEIDAYPGQTFAGIVDSVQSGTGARFSLFPPENATGNFVKIVQRVPVKITFQKQPDAALHLGPGMSVTPTVHIK